MTIKTTWKAKLILSLAIIWTILILYLSLANIGKIKIIDLKSSDKLYHAGCYFILVLLWLSFIKLKYVSSKKYIAVTISAFVFGIIIEILQYAFTSYRTLDWWDVLANGTGIAFGYLLFTKAKQYF